jgi:type II secretory pathway pseudopilin PulG
MIRALLTRPAGCCVPPRLRVRIAERGRAVVRCATHSHPCCAGHSHPRSAYTLAEMLVVITIMIMLVATALPVAKKVMEGSQTREASRQLNAYLTMARTRTLQTGRPCGIYFAFNQPTIPDPFEKTLNQPAQFKAYWPVRQVSQMYLSEIPPPFSGAVTGSKGCFWPNGIGFCPAGIDSNGMIAPQSNLPLGMQQDWPVLLSLLVPGEQFLIQFDNKGPWFICQAQPNSNGSMTIQRLPGFQTGPWFAAAPATTAWTFQPPFAPALALSPGNATPKTYQIYRAPRPIGNPLELPRGTCIDMTYSGVGTGPYARQFPLPASQNMLPTGVTVLFSTTGGIDSIFVHGLQSYLGGSFQFTAAAPTLAPIASLYLLLGKTEKFQNPTTSLTSTGVMVTDPTVYTNLDNSNLADPNSLWMVINRNTGQVTTTENMPPPIDRTSLSSSNVTIFPNSTDPKHPTQTFNGQNISQAILYYVLCCRQAATQGEQMVGR